MSSDLLLDVEDHSKVNSTMTKDAGDISIDQDGEWDINLFDELDDLCDTDELLQALVSADYTSSGAGLNLDIDLPVWDSGWGDSGSTSTGVSEDCFSLSNTPNSVSSPASVEAYSPYSSHDDALSPLSPESQPSPVSVCSDSSGFSELPLEQKPGKKANQTRAKSSQPAKRANHVSPKVCIQPKPLLPAPPLPQVAAPLQTKTIIIQPIHTTILPVVKPPPVSIQPAPSSGAPILLSPPTQVLQLHPSQPMATRVLTVPTLAQDGPAHLTNAAAPSLPVAVSFQNSLSDEDSSMSRRQQRMIKNRESASLSRRKKKEYLMTLEARLKVALSENEKLKSENGTLKRQLEGLRSENTVLKTTAPKRRAVCLMVVLVFLVFNAGPMWLLEKNSGSILSPGPVPSGRHLLEFSTETPSNDGGRTVEWGPSHTGHRREDGEAPSEEKALMVVKREPLFRPAPPCQPLVNKTKCMKMASELRGWVHRHETERTKSWRSSSSGHPRARTIPKTSSKKAEMAQIVTVQYSASSEKRLGSELQVYYAPRHIYSDFFDEINRRGDTFYVVSFRRDHLLLPATNHNKGSRPKMSLLLPAVNMSDSVIKDKEFEVMMQIDCEVMDTRILHIKSSSVPPILRVNETGSDSFFHSSANGNQPAAPVGVLVGTA